MDRMVGFWWLFVACSFPVVFLLGWMSLLIGTSLTLIIAIPFWLLFTVALIYWKH